MAAPVISGIGLLTPLGMTAAATWEALLAGRSIAGHARAADLNPQNEPRINVLARLAARQAVDDAKWNADDLREAALVVGTSKGPVQRWVGGGENLAAEAAFGVADVAASLQMTGGPRLTICAACASGLAALIRACMMIQGGEARQVLVVAAESSLQPLFIGSFERLGILANSSEGCRPFDLRRRGFFLSEAAAAVCLQSDGPGYAGIERFALAGDATHLTGSDPHGRTIRHLLKNVGWAYPPTISACQQAVGGYAHPTLAPIDLIHAHGTGTVANDELELAAIEAELSSPSPCTQGEGRGEGSSLFDEEKNPHPNPLPGYRERGQTERERRPLLYSHKGALGHSLGAASLISVVLNCLMHRTGVVPPMTRTTQPMPAHAVRFPPADQAVQSLVRGSIVLAAGFGGASAALRLQTVPG